MTDHAIGDAVTVALSDSEDADGIVRSLRCDGTADAYQVRVVVETNDGRELDQAAGRVSETSMESVL